MSATSQDLNFLFSVLFGIFSYETIEGKLFTLGFRVWNRKVLELQFHIKVKAHTWGTRWVQGAQFWSRRLCHTDHRVVSMATVGHPLTAVPSSCLKKEVNYQLFTPFTRVLQVIRQICWHSSLWKTPYLRQNDGKNVILKWNTAGYLKASVIVGKWLTTLQAALNMKTAKFQTCLQT